MKKLSILFTFAALVALSFTSCRKKEDEVQISKTETVSLKVNESYTFTLPKNTTDDLYAITAAASHASISSLGKNSAGEDIYQYTPAKDFYGTDNVTVATVEETHPGKPGGHGKCQKAELPDIQVNFHFTIDSTVIIK